MLASPVRSVSETSYPAGTFRNSAPGTTLGEVTTLDIVTAVVIVLGGLGFVAYVVREAVRGAPERRAEAEAREFYSRHGRWPDEATPPA